MYKRLAVCLLASFASVTMSVSSAVASSDSHGSGAAPRSSVRSHGVGYTDVSTLTVAGVITPANSTPVAPAIESGTLAGATAPRAVPAVVNVNCGTRIDWYRIIDTSGLTYCYSNAGDASVLLHNIKYLCPGNNNGYVTYQIPGNTTYYNSTYRTPPANYNTCYAFPNPVLVYEIHLR